MPPRLRLFEVVAGQLARPHGPLGRVVGALLDRANGRLVAAAVSAAAAGDGCVVVEVGFGGGAGLEQLLTSVGDGGVVHGVEISQAMLAGARRRFRRHVATGRLVLHEATMSQLPLTDGSVDAVVSTNTVFFVDDLDAACVELSRVLRPGGRLVVGVDDPDAMARMPFTAHGFRLRSFEDIAGCVRRAGFTAVGHRPIAGGRSPHLVVGSRTD